MLHLDFQTVAFEPTLARPRQAARPEPVKPVKNVSSGKVQSEPARMVPAAQIPTQPVVQESSPPVVDAAGQSSPPAIGHTAVQGKGAGVASASSGDSASLREVAFGEASGPSFIKRIPPEYPQQAKRLGRQGTVVLRLHISELGELLSVEIVEACSTLFAEVTLQAIRASSFRPASINGKAVACMAILPIRFELKN